MSNKTRLDVLLVERGLEQTRQRAQAMIMSGLVFADGQRVDKAGTAVPNDAQIEVRGNTLRYVSRGGLKLEKAMTTFGLELDGCVCADIGFTDCMLQNGATKVYAVDVGYGQLDWKLRSDERVVCMERTNARYLDRDQIPDELDFASIDVSFISLKLILPAVHRVLKEGGHVACLIKPQFEAGREKVGKKGVVRDPDVHLEVLENFLTHAKEGYYDGVSFHRVISDFMIQGGDPKGDGTGGESIWGKEFENEVSDKMLNFNGAMAMANAGPDTNGSQCFIVQASTVPEPRELIYQQYGQPQEAIDKYNEVGGAPWLDGSYTVFGQVFDGMDVVNKIVEETSGNTDENGIVPEDERAIIESITVAPATDYFNYAE